MEPCEGIGWRRFALCLEVGARSGEGAEALLLLGKADELLVLGCVQISPGEAVLRAPLGGLARAMRAQAAEGNGATQSSGAGPGLGGRAAVWGMARGEGSGGRGERWGSGPIG